MISLSKAEVRAKAGSIRAGMSEPDSEKLSQALAVFLHQTVPSEKLIVVFSAMPGEVDLRPLTSADPNRQSRYAVTRTPNIGHELTVHPLGCQTELHPFGYSQPVQGSVQVPASDIGAVLVPGLMFDGKGGRVGRGKGFYDRLLQRLPSDTLRVGITGDVLVDRVPTEDHDVPMTHLAGSFGVLPVPVPDQLITHRLAEATQP